MIRTITPRALRTWKKKVKRNKIKLEKYPEDVERPKTRVQCINGPRPCPWVTCRYHLYLDITSVGGVKINNPELEPWELEQTCALDVADEGDHTLEYIGGLMNLTRERVRQTESRAIRKVNGSLDDWEDKLEKYRKQEEWYFLMEGNYEHIITV